MKKLLFVLIALFLIKYSQAQVLTPIDAESNIEFSIKNFGMQTKGTIKGLQGKIEFNAQKLATSYFNVSLNASTVNTNNSSRDKHLKKQTILMLLSTLQLHLPLLKLVQQLLQIHLL